MVDENHDAILGELTRAVVERFAPERIVLFGSRARGDHHPDSDYDLMVVLDEPPEPWDAVARTIHDIRTNVDVLVDTCERFERRRTDIGTLEFVVDREGRILYARAPMPELRQVRETPNGPPESLQEWIARAENDFTIMELGLNRAPGVRDVIVFHAHQGVEKILKTALVGSRVPPPHTHNLTELLEQLPDELRNNRGLREACAGLYALWPNSRYPHEPLPSDEQVRQAVAWARQAREIMSTAIAE